MKDSYSNSMNVRGCSIQRGCCIQGPQSCFFLRRSFLSNQAISGRLPNLPDVTPPFGEDRRINATDEFSLLTGRYGEPDLIRFHSVETLARIPVEIALYEAAKVAVAFVPNGCVDAYEQMVKVRTSSDSPATRRRSKKSITL